MPAKKTKKNYSLSDSLEMLGKLQKMAIESENINLALKAEELKCKIVSRQTENNLNDENLTHILVDFTDGKNNGEDSGNICPAAEGEEKV